MVLEFVVRAERGNKEIADVGYDCPCGCHPSAKYQRGSSKAAFEHCCCGRVHFAGADAEIQLRGYLGEREADGEETDRKPYELTSTAVRAPWGEVIQVAYAIPNNVTERNDHGDHDQDEHDHDEHKHEEHGHHDHQGHDH